MTAEERIALVLEAMGYIIDPNYVRYVLANKTFDSLEEAVFTVLYDSGNRNADKEVEAFFDCKEMINEDN